jgi:CO dehydrogenase maturation factor
MEAGLEHLSRSTTRSSDVMLAVAEPYYKSLETAARITQLAAEMGIPQIYLVANKTRTVRESQVIETFCANHNLDLLAVIPYDEKIAEASQIPQSPVDYCPESEAVMAIINLAVNLQALQTQ